MELNELTTKQIKNLKRKVVAYIWKTTTVKVIEIALSCGIKVPKNLITKYLSNE